MRHRTHRFAIPLALTLTAILAAAAFAGKGGNNGGNDNTNYAFVYNAGDWNSKSLSYRQGGLYLTAIDGTTTRQLTSGGYSPVWSPDLDPDTPEYQGVIAFYDVHAGDPEMWLIDPVTGEERFVKSFRNELGPYQSGSGKPSLVWSPNGRELLFSTRSHIRAVEVATGNTRTLVADEIPYDDDNIDDPAISSLGLLAFQYNGNIYTVDFELDEAGLIQVDPAAPWTWITGGFNLAWSPDGTRLAFVHSIPVPDSNNTYDLIVYDLLFDDFQVILNNDNKSGFLMEPTWSPDASELAVSLRNAYYLPDGDIYRITNWDDPDSRQIINVTQTEVTEKGGWNEATPNWNPGWIRE